MLDGSLGTVEEDEASAEQVRQQPQAPPPPDLFGDGPLSQPGPYTLGGDPQLPSTPSSTEAERDAARSGSEGDDPTIQYEDDISSQGMSASAFDDDTPEVEVDVNYFDDNQQPTPSPYGGPPTVKYAVNEDGEQEYEVAQERVVVGEKVVGYNRRGEPVKAPVWGNESVEVRKVSEDTNITIIAYDKPTPIVGFDDDGNAYVHSERGVLVKVTEARPSEGALHQPLKGWTDDGDIIWDEENFRTTNVSVNKDGTRTGGTWKSGKLLSDSEAKADNKRIKAEKAANEEAREDDARAAGLERQADRDGLDESGPEPTPSSSPTPVPSPSPTPVPSPSSSVFFEQDTETSGSLGTVEEDEANAAHVQQQPQTPPPPDPFGDGPLSQPGPFTLGGEQPLPPTPSITPGEPDDDQIDLSNSDISNEMTNLGPGFDPDAPTVDVDVNYFDDNQQPTPSPYGGPPTPVPSPSPTPVQPTPSPYGGPPTPVPSPSPTPVQPTPSPYDGPPTPVPSPSPTPVPSPSSSVFFEQDTVLDGSLGTVEQDVENAAHVQQQPQAPPPLTSLETAPYHNQALTPLEASYHFRQRRQ